MQVQWGGESPVLGRPTHAYVPTIPIVAQAQGVIGWSGPGLSIASRQNEYLLDWTLQQAALHHQACIERQPKVRNPSMASTEQARGIELLRLSRPHARWARTRL